jgi:hypothetical protein
MALYLIDVKFGTSRFLTEVEATTPEDANIIAMDLAAKEFGPNLDGITYNIEEVK